MREPEIRPGDIWRRRDDTSIVAEVLSADADRVIVLYAGYAASDSYLTDLFLDKFESTGWARNRKEQTDA